MIRQILYVSLSTAPGDGADLLNILEQSRHNNAIDGITGLLWSDGIRFLQVLEGPDESVAATFQRIQNDSRHKAIKLLRDALIDKAEFGYWTMAHRRAGEPSDIYDAQMRRRLANASPSISDVFREMISKGDIDRSAD